MRARRRRVWLTPAPTDRLTTSSARSVTSRSDFKPVHTHILTQYPNKAIRVYGSEPAVCVMVTLQICVQEEHSSNLSVHQLSCVLSSQMDAGVVPENRPRLHLCIVSFPSSSRLLLRPSFTNYSASCLYRPRNAIPILLGLPVTF
jgi:hypothetical protein